MIEIYTNDYDAKINASETTVFRIKEVFRLGQEQCWNLVEDNLVEAPSMLSMS